MDQNPHRNRRLALSNKIDAFGGDGENEKQDWRLQRQAVAMAMAIARDIQPHSTQKPTDQAHSTRKQWETKEERAIGGDGDRRRWRSTEARERKIDERKKDRLDERKKEMRT